MLAGVTMSPVATGNGVLAAGADGGGTRTGVTTVVSAGGGAGFTVVGTGVTSADVTGTGGGRAAVCDGDFPFKMSTTPTHAAIPITAAPSASPPRFRSSCAQNFSSIDSCAGRDESIITCGGSE